MTEDEKRVYPGAPDQEPAPVFDQQQSLFEDEYGTGIIGERSIDETEIEIYGENPPEHEDFADMLTSEDPEELAKILDDIKRYIGRQITLSESLASSFAPRMIDTVPEVSAAFKDIFEAKKLLLTMFDGMSAIIPALAETNKYIAKALESPKYRGVSLSQILGDYRKSKETGEHSLFEQLIDEVKTLSAEDAKENEIIKATEALLSLQSSTGTPKYYSSPNTYLANALTANDGKGEVIGGGEMELPVIDVGKRNEVTIIVDATLEGVTFTGKPYTEFDRAVQDAVCSISEDRKKNNVPAAASADMIYRTMTHKTSAEKVSPQQRGAVTKSIEKQRHIYVKADLTAEMQRRGIITNPNGKTEAERHRLVLDDYLLSATHFDNMAAGGSRVSGYIFKEPILLQYAKITGQLLTVRGKLLDVKKIDKKGNVTTVSLSNNENRIAIKSYLLRRVEVMRKDEEKALDAYRKYNKQRAKDNTAYPEKKLPSFYKQSRVILIEKLFEATGIENKNTKTNCREYVTQVLDYWKATGNIKGYKQRKKGKTIDAVVIEI